MEYKQIHFETVDYFNKEQGKSPYSTLILKDDYYYIKVMIFRQSSRVVYRAVLSFWDVERMCKHTSIKPKDDKQVLLTLNNIKNRYLEPNHGKEIKQYIKNNIEDYILPNLTAVVDSTFPIVYSIDDNKTVTSEIFKELNKQKGCIFGFIKVPKDTVFTIADGNHRTYAIHELVNNGVIDTDIEGLYVGIDFYLEVDKQKEKQLFVTLNTNKSIDSSVMSLLKENDLISNATKSLLGIMENYKISFNIIKNIVSILAVDSLNGDKKFNEMYLNNKLEYMKFMKKASNFLNYIFNNCEPFNKIKSDQSNVKELREKYISMTGAGLYVIARIGHIGIKYDGIDMEKLAEALCKLEWRRVINNKKNTLFTGGILTSEGKISNNRTALNTTNEEIKKILKLTDRDIEKIVK